MTEIFGTSISDYRNDADSLKARLSNLENQMKVFRESIQSNESDLFKTRKDEKVGSVIQYELRQQSVDHPSFNEADRKIVSVINSVEQLLSTAESADITRELLIDAQHEMANIEKNKARAIHNMETGITTTLKRGVSRAVTVIFIASALLLIGIITEKSNLSFPNIPIIRIGS